MGRALRAVADGLIYHALNRGNNRQTVFFGPDDFRAFLHVLAQTKERYPFRLFGYCLISNHFHLLLRPEPGQVISRILQSLTVAHTWHYHKDRASVGHVWQGRFRSPVVQDDNHSLVVLRYIEANPVRAGIVNDAGQYPWSSCAAHGQAEPTSLLDELPGWPSVAATDQSRQSFWRKWVHTLLTERELHGLRETVTSGRPYGEPAWIEAMSQKLGISLAPRRRGRPPKAANK